MNKASRAERRNLSDRPFAQGSDGRPSATSGHDLATALAVAAETGVTSNAPNDPAAPTSTSTPVDRQEPAASTPSEPQNRPIRPHIEDDFFAKGEDMGTMPPASFDMPDIDHDEHVRRRAHPGAVERRARLRRIVGSVIGAAAFLTALGGAKALITHTSPAPVAESALSVPSRVVPSIALSTGEDNEQAKRATVAADQPAAPPDEPSSGSEPQGDLRTSHRLPVVDVEIPAAPDAATDRAWETAAQNLSARDFRGADDVFAELGRRDDIATRETARLARAAWWIANGKQAEVRPVLADLAAKATTPSVQKQARELLRAN